MPSSYFCETSVIQELNAITALQYDPFSKELTWTFEKQTRVLANVTFYGLQAGSGSWSRSICPTRLLKGPQKLRLGARSGVPQNAGPLDLGGHGNWQQEGQRGLIQIRLPSSYFAHLHCRGHASAPLALPQLWLQHWVCSRSWSCHPHHCMPQAASGLQWVPRFGPSPGHELFDSLDLKQNKMGFLSTKGTNRARKIMTPLYFPV